jgi:hypothetical protein
MTLLLITPFLHDIALWEDAFFHRILEEMVTVISRQVAK